MTNKRLWQWRGINTQGEPVQGSLWASGRDEVQQRLWQQHVTPVSLKRCAIKSSHWKIPWRCDVITQLATLLRAGLTLSDSLEMLSQQHPSVQWQSLLQTLGQQLQQGVALSEALRQWPQAFPPLWLAMIRTGELTGKLEQCCFHLAAQQKKQYQLTQKVKKSLRYPVMVLSLALLVIMAMVWFVLPEFAAIYRTFNTPLPALTQWVMAFASLMERITLPVLAGSVVLFLATLRIRKRPRWLIFRQRVLLAIPVAGKLARGQALSHIFTVLALTQSAGIGFLQGVECVEETMPNPWWQNIIHQLRQEIIQGAPVWQAMANSHAFTPLCLQLVRTGEMSGALESLLNNLAQHHHDVTEQTADNLTALLEPALLLVTGVIIGTLVVAMYLPVFHLGDAISGAG